MKKRSYDERIAELEHKKRLEDLRLRLRSAIEELAACIRFERGGRMPQSLEAAAKVKALLEELDKASSAN